jgi:hypothetical protein
MEPFAIRYRFEVEDGSSAEFEVALDPATFLAPTPRGELPGWTRLDFHRCPNCPLEAGHGRTCPAAAQLPKLVEAFDHLFSYTKARVEVETRQRTILQETTIQQGVGALMGLLMAASGCPLTAFFRPMARFHLPFADPEETTFRAASTFLLGQYFRARGGACPEGESLEGLSRIYGDLHEMNKAMADRIRAATRTDASVNALIVLDMFTVVLPFEVESHLTGLEGGFSAYLEP